MKSVVPYFIGLQHISREDAIQNHTRPLAQEPFSSFTDQKAIAVFDGTYIYIQKSNETFLENRTVYTKASLLLKPRLLHLQMAIF